MRKIGRHGRQRKKRPKVIGSIRGGFGPSSGRSPVHTDKLNDDDDDEEQSRREGERTGQEMPPVSYAQDLPPAGGFAPVQYKRNLPIRGPGGALIFGVVGAICTFGFWRVGLGNLEKRELQREKVWSRIHLVPLLLAESDRDVYRRDLAALAREKEIMKDVPGWEAGKKVYHSKRYNPNTIVVI